MPHFHVWLLARPRRATISKYDVYQSINVYWLYWLAVNVWLSLIDFVRENLHLSEYLIFSAWFLLCCQKTVLTFYLKIVQIIIWLCVQGGLPGEVGNKGMKGTAGLPGDRGPQGSKGDTGPTGNQGASVFGPQGSIGDPGPEGPLGPPGTQGTV